MAFKKGISGNPKGKKPGTLTKVSSDIKADVLDVYHQLGGKGGLKTWAESSQRNRATFYNWVISKLLPALAETKTEVTGSGKDGSLRIEVIHVKPEGGNGGNGDEQK